MASSTTSLITVLASVLVAPALGACASDCPCQRGPATSTPEPAPTDGPEGAGETTAEPNASEPTAGAGEGDDAQASKCSDPRQRSFDFWAGSWVVHSQEGKLAGHNHIEIAHEGCALIERWRSAGGGGGTSTNYFDPVKQLWVQNWVDSSGNVIQLEGDLSGGAMVLVGRMAQPDGTQLDMRGTWTPLEDGRVRQFFEVSSEGGDWKPVFEGFYSREDPST